MTGDASAILLHGHNVTRLDPDQADQVAANDRLIHWVIEHKCRGIVDDGYGYADAYQDGWLGLAAAVQIHSNSDRFARHAVDQIWKGIVRGRGLHSGRNWRRKAHRRTAIDRPPVFSLSETLDLGEGEGSTLADRVPDHRPGPDQVVTDALDLAAAVTAGRRACTDHIDRAVLAWMLDPTDERPIHDLATQFRRNPEAIRRRRLRILDRMTRAMAA